MIALTSQQRRELRARAHALHPVVSVGQHGLTPQVIHEIDVALRAHGLIKVRVFSEDRAQRETMLAQLADELDAAPVQHLGKLLIFWRPLEDKPVKRARRPSTKPKERRAATSTRPSKERRAREPREPETAGRRARGTAPADSARNEPDSRRRRRATTTKRVPRTDDAQTPDRRHRRRAGATAEAPPVKRPPRESASGASREKPAIESRRRPSSSLEAVRPPKGKSAPNPRRRRRAG